MTTLITGSTGYIGSLLTIKLAEAGEDVRILVRKDPSIPEFNKPNIKVFRGDIGDPESLKKSHAGCSQSLPYGGLCTPMGQRS
jgi:uncharacterized protein YbjT (DUF2867 family)